MTADRVAWPFAIGRGREIGYRVLLAPAQIIETGLLGRLEQSVGGAAGVQVIDVDLGADFTQAAFTTWRLRPRDGGLNSEGANDQWLLDRYGRPIEVIHGFLVSGGQLGEVEPADLELTREAVASVLPAFLADEGGWRASPSQPFSPRSSLRVAQRTSPPRPDYEDGQESSIGRMLTKIVGALVVLLGLIAVTQLGNDDGPLRLEPSTCDLSSEAESCSAVVSSVAEAPVRFTVSQISDGPRLAWETVDGCSSVAANRPCSLTVTLAEDIPTTPGEAKLNVTTEDGAAAQLEVRVGNDSK